MTKAFKEEELKELVYREETGPLSGDGRFPLSSVCRGLWLLCRGIDLLLYLGSENQVIQKPCSPSPVSLMAPASLGIHAGLKGPGGKDRFSVSD